MEAETEDHQPLVGDIEDHQPLVGEIEDHRPMEGDIEDHQPLVGEIELVPNPAKLLPAEQQADLENSLQYRKRFLKLIAEVKKIRNLQLDANYQRRIGPVVVLILLYLLAVSVVGILSNSNSVLYSPIEPEQVLNILPSNATFADKPYKEVMETLLENRQFPNDTFIPPDQNPANYCYFDELRCPGVIFPISVSATTSELSGTRVAIFHSLDGEVWWVGAKSPVTSVFKHENEPITFFTCGGNPQFHYTVACLLPPSLSENYERSSRTYTPPFSFCTAIGTQCGPLCGQMLKELDGCVDGKIEGKLLESILTPNKDTTVASTESLESMVTLIVLLIFLSVGNYQALLEHSPLFLAPPKMNDIYRYNDHLLRAGKLRKTATVHFSSVLGKNSGYETRSLLSGLAALQSHGYSYGCKGTYLIFCDNLEEKSVNRLATSIQRMTQDLSCKNIQSTTRSLSEKLRAIRKGTSDDILSEVETGKFTNEERKSFKYYCVSDENDKTDEEMGRNPSNNIEWIEGNFTCNPSFSGLQVKEKDIKWTEFAIKTTKENPVKVILIAPKASYKPPVTVLVHIYRAIIKCFCLPVAWFHRCRYGKYEPINHVVSKPPGKGEWQRLAVRIAKALYSQHPQDLEKEEKNENQKQKNQKKQKKQKKEKKKEEKEKKKEKGARESENHVDPENIFFTTCDDRHAVDELFFAMGKAAFYAGNGKRKPNDLRAHIFIQQFDVDRDLDYFGREGGSYFYKTNFLRNEVQLVTSSGSNSIMHLAPHDDNTEFDLGPPTITEDFQFSLMCISKGERATFSAHQDLIISIPKATLDHRIAFARWTAGSIENLLNEILIRRNWFAMASLLIIGFFFCLYLFLNLMLTFAETRLQLLVSLGLMILYLIIYYALCQIRRFQAMIVVFISLTYSFLSVITSFYWIGFLTGYMAYGDQLGIKAGPIFVILLMNTAFTFLINLQIIKWQKKMRYVWGKRLCMQHFSHNMVCWIIGGFETLCFILNGFWNFFLYPVWNVTYMRFILILSYPLLLIYLLSLIVGVVVKMIIASWQDLSSWEGLELWVQFLRCFIFGIFSALCKL